MEEIVVLGAIIHYVTEYSLWTVLLALLVLCIVTFLGYVKVMVYYRRWKAGTAKWYHYFIGVPLGVIFIPLDVLLNIVVGSVLFLELPKEWLFTTRLDRHAKKGSKFAQWVCKYILNPFDENHCYGKSCDIEK
jgi:hypothetical protein